MATRPKTRLSVVGTESGANHPMFATVSAHAATLLRSDVECAMLIVWSAEREYEYRMAPNLGPLTEGMLRGAMAVYMGEEDA